MPTILLSVAELRSASNEAPTSVQNGYNAASRRPEPSVRTVMIQLVKRFVATPVLKTHPDLLTKSTDALNESVDEDTRFVHPLARHLLPHAVKAHHEERKEVFLPPCNVSNYQGECCSVNAWARAAPCIHDRLLVLSCLPKEWSDKGVCYRCDIASVLIAQVRLCWVVLVVEILKLIRGLLVAADYGDDAFRRSQK